LDGLSDVNAPTPDDGDVLAWDDGTSNWVNIPPPAGSMAGVPFQITAVFDAGTSAITGNPEVDVVVPAAGTLTGWTMMANASGTFIVDVWKDVGGAYPPTDADSIVNGHEPTLSGAYTTDTDLSDWTSVALTAGDVIRFHVDTVGTVKRVALTLHYTRS
jgi:hypothetical protein